MDDAIANASRTVLLPHPFFPTKTEMGVSPSIKDALTPRNPLTLMLVIIWAQSISVETRVGGTNSNSRDSCERRGVSLCALGEQRVLGLHQQLIKATPLQRADRHAAALTEQRPLEQLRHLVDLVSHQQAWRVLEPERLEDLLNRLDVRRARGVRRVDDVQQQRGVFQLLQGGPKRRDQVLRKITNEATVSVMVTSCSRGSAAAGCWGRAWRRACLRPAPRSS